jgi:DinB superfamily
MKLLDRDMLWRQFGAAIDMLGDALRNCPDALWEKMLWDDEPGQWVAAGFSRFWYLGYHTLFWLDLYLTGAEEGFMPPEPFALVEMQDNETLPRTYTRDELLGYLAVCRQRCQDTLLNLGSEQAERPCSFAWGRVTFAELMLYTLRHVQEHAAHLNMYIGQHAPYRQAWQASAG